MDITSLSKSDVMLLLTCIFFDMFTTARSGNFILYDNPVTCHAGVIFNMTVPSVLACAAICHRHSDCMSMLYNMSRCIGCDKTCSSLDIDLSSTLRCWDLKSDGDILEPRIPPLDCLDLYLANRLDQEGAYVVSTTTTSTRDLFCMEDGYTVFLKRNTGEVAFDQAFSNYENGFGDITGDFWLGLNILHELTNSTESYLKIKSCCKNGAPGIEIWNGFSVGPRPDYKLRIGKLDFASYEIQQTNLRFYFNLSNNMPFSTKEHDRDTKDNYSCSQISGSGGWWYEDCNGLNPTGRYSAESVFDGKSMYNSLFNSYRSLQEVYLMFKRSF